MSKIDVDQTVRELEAGKTPKWISEHMRIYRESGGAEGHMWDSSAAGFSGLLPTLLLTTVGRRSGEKRTSPLIYGTVGDAFIVIGSKGGADTHPRWYLNLLANPVVELQVGKERFVVRARVSAAKEREQLWEQMLKVYPPYRDYQQKTKREIPLIVLEKQVSRHRGITL
jgi:deazaflavin-dependent oxidoreductase (nitroreductase family)